MENDDKDRSLIISVEDMGDTQKVEEAVSGKVDPEGLAQAISSARHEVNGDDPENPRPLGQAVVECEFTWTRKDGWGWRCKATKSM